MPRLRVAYLGPRHSFTHIAATRLFPDAEYVAAKSITEVFNLVESYEASYGVVPLENSLEGPVGETLDNLASTMLSIYAGLEMRIKLVLATGSENPAKKLYSHPHAYGEAYHNVARILSSHEFIPTTSTSQAATEAARNHAYCLCSEQAARKNNLKIILEDASTAPNYTRFITIAWHDQPRNAHRTMLITALPDKPGSLHDWLEPFAKREINLKMIYSRPVPSKPWHYNFYIELEGTRLDKNIAEALQEAKQRSLFLRILGSYPYRQES